MIENQKYYYSNLIYRTFDQVLLDHNSYVRGSTTDVNFGSPVSPIIVVPGLSSSALGFGSRVPCKIRVPDLGFSGPTLRVPSFGYRVLHMKWVPGLGSLVSPFESRVSGPGSRVPGLTHMMGLESRFLGPTKSLGSRVPLFGYAFLIDAKSYLANT